MHYLVTKNYLYWIGKDSRMLCNIQMMSFVVLMVCLIRIPSMILEILFREVPFATSVPVVEMIQLVAKWNRHYLLVRDLVANISQFFGYPILLFILYAFITSINYTFAAIIVLWSTNTNSIIPSSVSYDFILIAIENVVCIVFIAHISEKIPQQVRVWNQSSALNG